MDVTCKSARAACLGATILLSVITPAIGAVAPDWFKSVSVVWAVFLAVSGLVGLWFLTRAPVAASRGQFGARAITVIGVAIGLLILAWALLGHNLGLAAVLGTTAYYVFVMAPWEEIWWRGVWFAAAPKLYSIQVGAGAALFGLMHAHHGLRAVLTALVLGWVYASARRAGAPLVGLIFLHGAFNTLSRLRQTSPDSLLASATDAFVVSIALCSIVAGFWVGGCRDYSKRPGNIVGD